MTNRDYYGILNLFVLEKVGGVLMKYIGSELQDRMNLLGISVSALSEVTFMDEDLMVLFRIGLYMKTLMNSTCR